MEKRESTYKESRDYMGRSGKAMTTSPTLRTKRPNNKQNSRTTIIDNNNKYDRKLFRVFKNSQYLGNGYKQVHNEKLKLNYY